MTSLRSRLLLCAALFALASPALAESLTITTEEYPPMNFSKDGKVVGSATELVEKVMAHNGIQSTITVYPWARALEMATKDPATCVYSTTRTPEREELFKWAGPVGNDMWVLVGRADSPKLKTIEDAKPYTIGGYKGDALTEYLKAQGFKVEETASDDLNPGKLRSKRIDFWANYKSEGADISKREGMEGLSEAVEIKAVSLYLACNKAVSDETIAKLNASFKALKEDGTMGTIIKKYNQ